MAEPKVSPIIIIANVLDGFSQPKNFRDDIAGSAMAYKLEMLHSIETYSSKSKMRLGLSS